MAIEVTLLKFIFSFRTIKCIALILCWVLITVLFFGVVNYTFWWHDCLYDQKCFEKQFLQNGVSQAISLTPDYIWHYITIIISYTFFLLLTIVALSLVGIKIKIDKTTLAVRLNYLKQLAPWIKSKYFIPVITSVYILLFLFTSMYHLNEEHKWNLDIQNNVQDDLGGFLSFRKKVLADKNQEHFYIAGKPKLSKYSNNIIYFNSNISDTVYDNQKYYRLKVNDIDFKKEMDASEKLNYFIDKVHTLKQVHTISSYTHSKKDNLSEYQINTTLETLKKVGSTGEIKPIVRKLENLKKSKQREVVTAYGGERYIIVGGKIAGNKVHTSHPNLSIELVSIPAEIKNAATGLLLEVKTHRKESNNLSLNCELVAQWE